MRFLLLCGAAVALAACGPVDSEPDANEPSALDSGADAGSLQSADAAVTLDAGARVDAGHDAGLQDAGLRDAGSTRVDAGVDAGQALDAGPFDAGTSSATTGVLVGGPGTWPGAIEGVRYISGAVSGVTNAQGEFHWQAGTPITFRVGDVEFPPVTGAAKLTPWQLARNTCTHTAALDKVLVLLFSLDDDNLASTGLRLALPAASSHVALASLSLSDVTTRVGQLISGRQALTAAAALERFIRQADDETWAELSMDSFNGTVALGRGQGVASDGTSWFFSGTLSLERTDTGFASQKSNSLAIPLLLALAGSDHIGDIDVLNGTLYAPIEDGSKGYKSPKVVLYDTQSLTPGTEYSISATLQTEGVPWVAVNGAKSEAYMAEWTNTTQLNVFNLSNFSVKSALPLIPPAGMTISRIQGAKVFESALYLATDLSGKDVFKVDLETGIVLRLFSVATTGEQEGLAFFARPDGTAMHTLNVNAARAGVELRHHQRTRASLRHDVCP